MIDGPTAIDEKAISWHFEMWTSVKASALLSLSHALIHSKLYSYQLLSKIRNSEEMYSWPFNLCKLYLKESINTYIKITRPNALNDSSCRIITLVKRLWLWLEK